jgi:ribosomal protein S18 acetylase RimI-like enzyme
MTVKFAVREMKPQDAQSVKQVIDLSFPRFYRFFGSLSLSDEGQVLIGEMQGAVAGFAKLIWFQVGEGKYGCILWVAVHPSFRKKGIARALVNAGGENLRQGDAQAVFASVSRRNAASLAVFDREGFRRMGFLGLWWLFGWHIFEFYRSIWFAPYEIVFMQKFNSK